MKRAVLTRHSLKPSRSSLAHALTGCSHGMRTSCAMCSGCTRTTERSETLVRGDVLTCSVRCVDVRAADRGPGEALSVQDVGQGTPHRPQPLSVPVRSSGAIGHHAVSTYVPMKGDGGTSDSLHMLWARMRLSPVSLTVAPLWFLVSASIQSCLHMHRFASLPMLRRCRTWVSLSEPWPLITLLEAGLSDAIREANLTLSVSINGPASRPQRRS